MTASGVVMVLVGMLVVALANYDALATTLAVDSGARPLSTKVAAVLRRLFRRAPRLLPAGGPVVVLSTVGVWVLLLWVGYSLLFLADPTAVQSSSTGEPASAVSRVYFAGYTLLTLGIGDYTPAEGVAQILTVVAAFNGLFIVTLSITYLLPIVGAVVERRQLAATITALGTTAEEALIASWDGEGFPYLEQQLPTLSQQILLTAQRHLAYPVLHDFRSSNRTSGALPALAQLDEVLTVLQHGVVPGLQLSPPVLRTLRFAIDEALRLMPGDPTVQEAPPLPDLGLLADAGIPVQSMPTFTAAAADVDDRRRRLAGRLSEAAWDWPTRAAGRT